MMKYLGWKGWVLVGVLAFVLLLIDRNVMVKMSIVAEEKEKIVSINRNLERLASAPVKQETEATLPGEIDSQLLMGVVSDAVSRPGASMDGFQPENPRAYDDHNPVFSGIEYLGAGVSASGSYAQFVAVMKNLADIPYLVVESGEIKNASAGKLKLDLKLGGLYRPKEAKK